MAKPISRMDTENLEDTTKIGQKTKNTISSSFHQIDPSQTKKIIAASSKQELKTDENNYKKIDLSSQDLNYIPTYLFANSEVEELDLSNNPRLAEEKVLVFPELNYLKKLNLSNCNFKNVPNQIFKFQQLEELNFSHNLLQFNFKLPMLENLKKLDLSGCGLTEIPGFHRFHRLKELNLSNNPLKHSALFRFTHTCLHTGLHSYPWNLEKLDLSGCGLTEIYVPYHFPHWFGCLKELNLSSNPLEHSDRRALLEQLRSMKHTQSLKVTFDDAVYIPKNYDEDVATAWSVYPQRASSPTRLHCLIRLGGAKM